MAGFAVAVAIGSGGCAANPAPGGWLPRAPETAADPYGAWIEVSLSGGTPLVADELLAVERDSVFVLSTAGTVHGIPISAGHRARIALYDSEWASSACGRGWEYSARSLMVGT